MILRKLFICFCVFVIVWNIGKVLTAHASEYINTSYWQRYPGLLRVYNDSQYANKHPKGWIPDETVNAYAGGAYARGVPPILIAPDTPPLGRYSIGLSALIFHNENTMNLLFFIASLSLVYLSAYMMTKSIPWSLVPVVIVTFDPLITNQLVYTPLLDIIQLVFLLAALYIFSIGYMKKRRYILFFAGASVFLGLFISTKFFISGMTIVAAWGISLIITSKYRRLVWLCATLPISIAILLMSYIRVFILGYSIREFLGIQKWVFAYHQSQLILPLTVWPLIYLNRWYVWYGNSPIISDPQWNILWPIATTVVVITGIGWIIRKIRLPDLIIPYILWALVYLAFLSTGQTTSRYLILFMPIAYIISTYGVFLFCSSCKKFF